MSFVSQNVATVKACGSSRQLTAHAAVRQHFTKIPSKYRVIMIREDLRLIRRKTGCKEPPKTDAFLVLQWQVLIWPL